MPKKMGHPFEFDEYIHSNVNFTIKQYRDIRKQHKKIERSIFKLEQACGILHLARIDLDNLVKTYKDKFENEERKKKDLTATYYLLAFNFLSDFSSPQTEDMLTKLREQIMEFIYSSFNNSITFCFQSPAFQELFKKMEDLELSFWYQERIAYTSLLMQEFLNDGYGMKIEFDQLPETELELFEHIKESTTQHMLCFDLDKYMNRVGNMAEDAFNDYHASISNAQVRRKYFQFSFKLSRYIGEQMCNFAEGSGLFDLAVLFKLHAERTKINANSSAIKEKMDKVLIMVSSSLPRRERGKPFWKNLIHRTIQAVLVLSEDEGPLFEIEEDWILHIMTIGHEGIDVDNLSILCDILDLHTKFKKGQLDMVLLEANYDHFSFMDRKYIDIDSSDMPEMLKELKKDNKEMEDDIKLMKESPDQLFKVLKRKPGFRG